MKRKRISGFSLIELLVAMAIVGILAAIAYPAYQDQMRKTRRSVAKTNLMEIASREEKFLSENARFTATILGTTWLNFRNITIDGNYNLSVALTAPLGFTATANARPDSDQIKDTPCTALTVNHLGQKTPASGCW